MNTRLGRWRGWRQRAQPATRGEGGEGQVGGGQGGGQGQLVLDQGDRGPAPARIPQQLRLDRLQRAEDGGPGPGVRLMVRSCI